MPSILVRQKTTSNHTSMKYRSFIYTGLAALAMASSSAFAQGIDVYEHGVTLTLTQYIEGEETETVSENSSKEVFTNKSTFVTRKFGNKQLLEALVEDGLIPSISGWSVKLYLTTDGNRISVFITKKNVDPIDISDYLDYFTNEIVDEYNSKETFFTNGNYDYNETFNLRGLAGVAVNVPGLVVETSGAFYSKQAFTEKQVGEEESVEDLKVKSVNIYNLVGVPESEGEGEEDSIVEGSVAVGSGKRTTLDIIEVLAD